MYITLLSNRANNITGIIIPVCFTIEEGIHNNIYCRVKEHVDPIQDNVYVRTVLEFKYNSCV